jgi:GAF domain-containing protein
MTIALSNLITVQRETVLLWVIDSAPLVIGVMAFFLGRRQDNMSQLNASLESKYKIEEELRGRLAQANDTLEQKIQLAIEKLERHAQFVDSAVTIGRAATSIYQIQELLDQAVNMISERFGFYQVGIFFLDSANEYAVMQAASSEGGKRMLSRQHRLKVGEEGMVGYVTSRGEARIALDVGEDAVHFNTPELPQTRSEMTLPLFYGGRVFGALDVQSTEPNAFSEEDIDSLTVLADQVSMAINNARLFSELQESLETERKAFSEVSRQAWHSLIRRSGTMGYAYNSNDQRTLRTEPTWPQEMAEALQKGEVVNTFEHNNSISVPIFIAEKPVGVIRLRKPETGLNWSEDEVELIQTLTDRLSQALESARVYQSSQMLALQEQLTTSISSQLRQTLDIDTVLKTAARELGEAFKAKEVVIRMATNESTQ